MPKVRQTQTSSLISNIRQDVQSLVQVLPAFVLVLDTYGVILTANEAVSNLLKSDVEDMPGKGIYELWPSAAPIFRERIQYVVKTQIPDSFEAGYDARQVNVYLYPITDGKKVSSLLVFGQDITERIRFERQVQELTSQLESKVLERTAKLRLEQRRQEILARFSIALMQTNQPAPIFQEITSEVSQMIGGLCAIVTLSPAHDAFIVQAASRLSPSGEVHIPKGAIGQQYAIGPNPILLRIAKKEPFIRQIISAEVARELIPSYFWHLIPEEVIETLHAVPLAVRDEVLGLIFFAYESQALENASIADFIESLANLISFAMQNNRLVEQLTASREELRGLSQQLVDVQESQYKYLAQEIHDQVGQNMTAININLNLVRTQLAEAGSPQVISVLDDSITLLADTVNRMRNLMAEFRPPMLDHYGLVAALFWHAERLEQRTKVKMAVVDRGLGNTRLPLPVEIALFRIAQEALNNVVKHANASQVEIEIVDRGDSLNLMVKDNGVGFHVLMEEDARPHWGLAIMRERAQSLGGQLEVTSQPNVGTRVVVSVPKGSQNDK